MVRTAETVTGDVRSAIEWRSITTAGLALLILCLPLARHWIVLRRPPFELYYEFTSFIIYLSDVPALLLLVAWVFGSQRTTQYAVRSTQYVLRIAYCVLRTAYREPTLVTLPLALLPVVAFVTAPWAGDPGLAVYVGLRLSVLLAVYLAIVALRPSTQVVQLALAASLVLQTALAIVQFMVQDDLGWQWLGEIELNPTSGFASVIAMGDQVWLRGYGLTPHPNILGGILAVMLLALLVPYLESQGRSRMVWLAVLVWGGSGLVVSFSRAAWLGGAIGGVLLTLGVLVHPWWRRRYARAVLLPAVVGLVVVAGFVLVRPDLFIARLKPSASPTESRSLNERQVLADASLALIRRVPLVGVGAGNFSSAVIPLVREVPETTPQPVHNLPLLLSAELGLAGGVLWVWLMLAPPILAWRRFRVGRLSLWALALTAGLVALALVDLFDFYSWGWAQGRLLRWVSLGLWSAALNESAG